MISEPKSTKLYQREEVYVKFFSKNFTYTSGSGQRTPNLGSNLPKKVKKPKTSSKKF